MINNQIEKAMDSVIKPMVNLHISESMKSVENRLVDLETGVAVINDTISEKHT